jgi:Phage derived protein Gp49-like (DUF891)
VTDGLRLVVEFFRTEAGNEPVREWIKSLPREDQKEIGGDINAVQLGWPVGMPLVRKLDANLWEVCSTLGNRVSAIVGEQHCLRIQ